VLGSVVENPSRYDIDRRKERCGKDNKYYSLWIFILEKKSKKSRQPSAKPGHRNTLRGLNEASNQ
jgi:hypothetical protein